MTTPEEALALASRVNGRSELADIRLVKSSIENLGFPEADSRLNYDLKIQPATRYSAEDGIVIVEVEFSLSIRAASGEEQDDVATVAEISFTHAALFTTSEEDLIAEDELDIFGKTTGVLAIYPYAREYVQDITGRLGLPPLVLDLYKVTREQLED